MRTTKTKQRTDRVSGPGRPKGKAEDVLDVVAGSLPARYHPELSAYDRIRLWRQEHPLPHELPAKHQLTAQVATGPETQAQRLRRLAVDLLRVADAIAPSEGV